MGPTSHTPDILQFPSGGETWLLPELGMLRTMRLMFVLPAPRKCFGLFPLFINAFSMKLLETQNMQETAAVLASKSLYEKDLLRAM